MRYLTVLFLTAALAGIASADITDLTIDCFPTPATVDLVPPGEIPADTYVTNDVMLTVDSDWLSAILIVTPDTTGQIYQNALGGNTPPNSALFAAYATLEYDTYVSDGLGGAPSLAAAVDYGYSSVVFDEDELALTYYTTATEIGELHMARVTMLNTASGEWTFVATASPEGGPKVIAEGMIDDGCMVPEPATLGLLAIGGLGVLIRRKR